MGVRASPATPLQPMTVRAVLGSVMNTKAQSVKNKLMRNAQVTKRMWKDLSDIPNYIGSGNSMGSDLANMKRAIMKMKKTMAPKKIQ